MNMAYCKHCHTELEMGALFCPECGYQVVEEPDPEPEPVPDPTPRRQSKARPKTRSAGTAEQYSAAAIAECWQECVLCGGDSGGYVRIRRSLAGGDQLYGFWRSIG